MPRVQFEVENDGIKKLLNDVGRRIGNDMPPNWGFTLMLYEYGEEGALFYISSAQRADMIRVMKEFIAKQS